MRLSTVELTHDRTQIDLICRPTPTPGRRCGRPEQRVGAQLLAGLASYLQSVLPTDPSAQLNFYAQLSNHDDALICRGAVASHDPCR
jgi:hypothetical protein